MDIAKIPFLFLLLGLLILVAGLVKQKVDPVLVFDSVAASILNRDYICTLLHELMKSCHDYHVQWVHII